MGRRGKKKVAYGKQLSIQVAPGLHQVLTALGYLRGDRGSYAGVCRELLEEGVQRLVGRMDGDKRVKYDEILATLQATAGLEQVNE